MRIDGVVSITYEESGIALPNVSISLNYRMPARYDDLLTINTKFKKYSSVKIEFDCEIWGEQNDLLTTAHFILVFVNMKTGRPMVPPTEILEIIQS